MPPAPMRPRRAAAPAKPPATVPVRASFGAGVCFAGVAGVEGTGVAVTEGVGVGVAGEEGVGVGVEADGVGAGLFVTLRIAMSVFAPTARAFAGLFGSTMPATGSYPNTVCPGTIS